MVGKSSVLVLLVVLRPTLYAPVSVKRPIFRRIRKIAKSDYLVRYVCPSVCLSVHPSDRMEQFGSH